MVDPANAVPEGDEFDDDATIVNQVRTTGSGDRRLERADHRRDAEVPCGSVAASSVIVYEILVKNEGSDTALTWR